MNVFCYEERGYQTKAVEEVLARFSEGKESVMLESPVGSGKTIMGLRVVKALQESSTEKVRVSWVACRRHILDQTREVNDEYFHCDIQFVSVFASSFPAADFVVLDEAHHEATVSCLKMYESSQNSRTLGLSATPLRSDKMKLSFRSTVRCKSIREFIEMGVLSPIHSYKIPRWNAEELARIYCESPDQWGKSLVFFSTIHECREFCELVKQEGITCDVVSAHSNRDAQLEAFFNNQLQVIANVAVLTEGFDVPSLQSVFVRDASQLPTIQMVGRGLRKAEGKKFCNIIQSSNTSYPVEKIADPVQSFRYMKSRWLSCYGDTEAVQEMVSITTSLLLKKEIRLPKYLSLPRSAKEIVI